MKFQITVATLATLLSAGSLSAQQVTPAQSPVKTQQVNQTSSVEARLSKEQVFAKCLAITNQEVVAIASFAKEKATHADVKALAATLEKSHQECLEELKGLAAKAAAGKKTSTQASPVANNTPNSNPNNRVENKDDNSVAYRATNNPNEVDFLQIHQEISDQCLKDGKEMLSKKEGEDFDSCFVGMQIAKHGMMHSSLTVLQRHTTGELQDFIKASLVKNDAHMKAATSLMERLSDSSVTRTAKLAK